jgi:hypothetical protein
MRDIAYAKALDRSSPLRPPLTRLASLAALSRERETVRDPFSRLPEKVAGDPRVQAHRR